MPLIYENACEYSVKHFSLAASGVAKQSCSHCNGQSCLPWTLHCNSFVVSSFTVHFQCRRNV